MYTKHNRSIQNEPTNHAPGYYRPRFVRYLALFVLLVVLSAAYAGDHIAHANPLLQGATLPGGTIPPGGTVPAPPIDPEQGQVRVFHLAPISTIANSTIDICTANNIPVVGLTGLTYLTQSGYITLAPGTYDWKVGTPGCATTLLDLPAFRVAAGTALTLLIVGDRDNQPLTSVLLVDANGQLYQLHLPLVLTQAE